MPTIPSLERRTVTPSSRVTNVNVADIGSVGRELGGAIDRTRAMVDEAAQKKTRYELADAKSKFGILMHQQNNAYEQDSDYATIPQRWGERVRSGADELLAGVSDPEARNMLQMEINERIAASESHINQLAFGKEREFDRANVFSQMEANREVYLGKDPVLAKNAAFDTKELLQASVDKGAFTQEVADEAYRTWKEDAAVGRLNMFDPEDQLLALDDPLIKDNLKSDTMAKLRRGVEGKILDKQAMTLVDSLPDDFSQMDALKFSETLADNRDLQVRFNQQARAKHTARKQAEREQMEEFHQKKFMPIATGKEKLDENDPYFRQLDTDLQISLKKVSEAGKLPPRARSNPAIINELINLKNENKFDEFRALVTTAAENGELSPSDTAKYTQVGIDGSTPEEWESEFTNDQRISSKLASNGGKYTTQSKLAVMSKMNDWERWHVTKFGKSPSDTDFENKLSLVIKDVELDPTSLWDTEKTKLYDLTYDQQIEVFTHAFDKPKEVKDEQFDLIVNEALSDGGPKVDGNGTSTFSRALRSGLQYSERLSDDTQFLLVKIITTDDEKVAVDVRDTFQNREGRIPSAQEFLKEYWELSNANRH